MNTRRLLVLLKKEVTSGTASFFIVFAIAIPVLLSLVVQLLFGSLFSEEASLGIYDAGSSEVTASLTNLDFMSASTYADQAALRDAVAEGAADMGLILPADFDQTVRDGELVRVDLLVWGESLAQHRQVVTATLSSQIAQLTGQEVPVTLEAVSLGSGENIPVEQRVLPLVVIMAVVMGGTLVPAASLVTEKEKHTLRALITTPVSLREVILAKGLMGGILAFLVGIVVLVLNDAFGTQPLLLAGILLLSTLLSAELGVMLGLFLKDTSTLFAVIKVLGIVLYAPALIYLFPGIPEWIAQLFPTYYFLMPITDIVQRGAEFADVVPELVVLVAMIVVLGAANVILVNMTHQREAYGV